MTLRVLFNFNFKDVTMKYMIALCVMSVANFAYGADNYKTFHGKISKGEVGFLIINPDTLPNVKESQYGGNVGVANFPDVTSGVYLCYLENGQPVMKRVEVVAPVTNNYLFPQLRSACQNGRCPK